MNQIFDKIFIIHLKKNKNRFFNLKKNINFKYTLVNGIIPEQDEINTHFDWKYYLEKNKDIKNINCEKDAREHFLNQGKFESRIINSETEIINVGQLGCLLSHIKIIQFAKKNKYKKILICEDDIRIHKEIEDKIKNIEKLDKWKLLYLGGAQDSWKDIQIKNNFYFAKKTRGTFAYAVKEELYDEILSLFCIKRKPADRYLIDLQDKYKNQIPVLYPNLIISDLTESDISCFRNNNTWFRRFHWQKYDYLKRNKIIILILTCNVKRQQIIRKTYLNDIKRIGYEYYFVIGGEKNEIIGDILYVQVEEKYENLPNKMILAYQFIFKNRKFDYIYKLDDDVIVNFDRLEDIPYYNFEYYGRLVGEKTFDRYSHTNKVSNDSIWKNKKYNKSYYGKWYGGGFSYFISFNAINILINNSTLIKNDLLEDKAIGDTLKLFGGDEYDVVENNEKDMSRFICNYYKVNFEKNKIIYFEVKREDMENVYLKIK